MEFSKGSEHMQGWHTEHRDRTGNKRSCTRTTKNKGMFYKRYGNGTTRIHCSNSIRQSCYSSTEKQGIFFSSSQMPEISVLKRNWIGTRIVQHSGSAKWGNLESVGLDPLNTY